MRDYGEWLDEKVSRAFGEGAEGRNTAGQFLTELRENWRDTEKRQDRNFISLIIGIVAFELVVQGSVQEVVFGFLRLKSLFPATVALPVVVAFLFYQMCALRTASTVMRSIHEAVNEAYFPEREDSGIDHALEPTGLSFGSTSPVHKRPGPAVAGILSTTVAGSIWFVLPPLFLIYAYLRLFDLEKADRPLVYASMALSAVFVLIAFLEVISGASHFDRDEPDLDP